MSESADTQSLAVDAVDLRRTLIDSFNEDELRDLCFTLQVEYEDLPPGGKSAKARELVQRMERERRLPQLAEAVLAARPHVPRYSLFIDTRTDQSPFKGLLVFEEEDADIFYGRETLTSELVQRLLGEQLPGNSEFPGSSGRFLALVGASGSGKSSVVRAGLLPAIRRQTQWPIHVITPTAHPLESTAVSLTRDSESVTAVTTLMDDMRRDPRSFHLHIRRLLSRGAEAQRSGGDNFDHLLLVVDQFEELFTLCRDETERQAFVENLVTAVHPDTAGPATIIITLRADFYSHCLQFASLHQLLEQQQKIVPAMTPTELREAIERPAARAGLVFEEGLVDLLLRDVGATGSQSPEPGALPLLSHALLETWKRREGNRLTLAGYSEAGGVHGAVAKTAESTYQRLSAHQQAIARNIFLRLTELGEGTQDTRRRADLNELMPRATNAAEVEAVLKLLADARLVTTSQDVAIRQVDFSRPPAESEQYAPTAYVEVAHEALIREWPTLRHWLDENREGLRVHRQLTEAAEDWDNSGRDPSYLYRGARLEGAREWAQSSDAALNDLEQAFLDASLAQQHDELAEARARAEREADAARKLRQRAIFLRGALIIAAALAIISFLLFGQSSRNAGQANAQSTRAFQNEGTAVAEATKANNALATAEAAQVRAENFAQAAQTAEAVAQVRATVVAQSAIVAATAEAQAREEAAESARQGNLARAQSLAALSAVVVEQNNDTEVSALLAIEAANINAENEGLMHWLIDAALRPLLSEPYFNNTLPGHEGWVTTLAYIPETHLLISGSDDHTVRLWPLADTSTGLRASPAAVPIVVPGHEDRVLAVAASPDGKWAISGSLDETIRLWPLTEALNGDTSGVVIVAMGQLTGRPAPRVRNLAVSNEGLLAATLDDSTLRLWPLEGLLDDTTSEPLWRQELQANAEAIAFSPDGEWLVSGHQDGVVQWWPVTAVLTGTITATIRSTLPVAVDVVAFSEDGNWIAAGLGNGDITLWPLPDLLADPATTPITWTAHTDSIRALAFTPDGKQVISGSEDKTIALWSLDAVLNSDLEPLDRLTGHEDSVRALVFTQEGRQFASASKDETIRLWQTTAVAAPRTLQSESGMVAVAFAPDGAWLAAGGSDRQIHLWPVATAGEAISFPAHDDEILSLAFSADGAWLASGSDDRRVKVWAVADIRATRPITLPAAEWAHEDRVMSVAFSPDSQRLASGGLDGTIRLWDVATQSQEPLVEWEGEDRVRAIAFSPDGRWLASGGDEQVVYVWSVTEPDRRPITLTGHAAGIRAMAISPDGRWLASGGDSNAPNIYLWDLLQITNSTQPSPIILRGHENGVRVLVFSPDNQWLASGSDDNTIRIWSAAHPATEPIVIRGHGNQVRGLAFQPPGLLLASAAQDGTVRLWLPLYDLAVTGCTQVRRNLTWEEWQRFLTGVPYRQTCPDLPRHPSVPPDG